MNWNIEFDLKGGRVKKLKKNGKLVLGTFDRVDGKTGNTHICVPNFAEEGMESGLPFHGPFRNVEWRGDLETGYVAREMGLEVTQEFELKSKFVQKVIVKNIGEVEQPVNVAIHNYLVAGNNWVGLKINGVDRTEEIIDSLFIEAKEHNVIEFMNGKKINLDLEGFNFFKLWTGFVEEEGQKVFDTEYVCIEPVRGKSGEYFGKEESMLKPGEVLEVSQTIYFDKK